MWAKTPTTIGKIKLENLVLIGLSGAGKSAVGKYLANKLERPFLDTDKIIISNTGEDIGYIFNNYGEAYFRHLESLVVNAVYKKEGAVISTGGGIILNPDNIHKLRENGLVFFLNANIPTLYRNLKEADNKNRPLLDKDNLKANIKETYHNRIDLYKTSCHYELSIDGKSIGEIGDEIIKIFNRHSSCS